MTHDPDRLAKAVEALVEQQKISNQRLDQLSTDLGSLIWHMNGNAEEMTHVLASGLDDVADRTDQVATEIKCGFKYSR